MGSSKVRKLNGGATGRLGHGREAGRGGGGRDTRAEDGTGLWGPRHALAGGPTAPRPRGP